MDEAEAIAQVKEGQVEAFEHLMNLHVRHLRGLVALRAPVPHLIDEVVHEAFIFAYEQIDSFEEGDFFAWLRAIALNLLRRETQRFCRERVNKQNYLEHLILTEAADAPESSLEVEHLEACLQRLQESARRLIDLRYRQSRSSDEIAALAGKTATWVRTNLCRIRTRLRQCVENRAAAGASR